MLYLPAVTGGQAQWSVNEGRHAALAPRMDAAGLPGSLTCLQPWPGAAAITFAANSSGTWLLYTQEPGFSSIHIGFMQ